MVQRFEAPLLRLREVAVHTVEVAFGVPESFSFVPGQYATITLHGLETLSMPEQFHDFSISSSPNTKGEITVTFRVSESPFKKRLLEMPLGTTVELEGPKGVFTLPPVGVEVVRLIAGGIGVTPFMSMIRFALETESEQRIRLDYYNTAPENTAYLAELTARADGGGNIASHVHYGSFTGAELVGDSTCPNGEVYYIAGPPGFVHAARTFLEKQGVAYDRIHTEEFSGYA